MEKNSYKFKEYTSLLIKKKILEVAKVKKKGHLGGSFSVLDILVSIFSSKYFKLAKKDFKLKRNDKVVLSKGHTAIALYGVMEKFKISKYYNLNDFNSKNKCLLEHPTLTNKNPEISVETGSLGHGLSISSGIALANFKNNKKKTICILGDGELYEGSNWEALFFISSKKLNNLLIIIDRNKLLTLGYTEDVVRMESLKQKFKSFNFNVIEINGHSYKNLENSFKKFSKLNIKSKPLILICNTIKGKGIIGMENTPSVHHGLPTEKIFKKSLEKISEQISKYEKI